MDHAAAPVDDGKSIGDAALASWRDVQAGKTVRLIGVSVSGIEDESGQLPLFGVRDTQRRKALNEAVDKLTARFGHTVVSRGGVDDS